MIRRRNGMGAFTLPTVLITSLVMLTLLLAALQLSTAAANALQTQYYNQLAREAAESGTKMAEACLREGNFDPTLLGHSLTPSTNCMGAPVTGANRYIVGNATAAVRTTFSVTATERSPGLIEVNANGTTERTRTSDNAVWQTYAQPLRIELTTGIIEANAINSGVSITCAIFDGETSCFGRNDEGQLGIGADKITSGRYDAPQKVLRQPGVLEGKVDKLVGTGNQQVCIVTTDNEIYCAGRNTAGKLGLPGGNRQVPVIEHVVKPSDMTGDITRIVHGVHHTCVISGGRVWCWGANNYGQLGDGLTADRATPREVSGLSDVTDLHAVPYGQHTCAVANGQAWCWGRNSRGQLWNNTTSTVKAGSVPQRVRGADGQPWNETVVMIRTSMTGRQLDEGLEDSPATVGGMTRAHTCALTATKRMYCWGANSNGQLGIGTTPNSEAPPAKSYTTPQLVGGALAGKDVEQISVSHLQSCALTQEGTAKKVYCWGSSQYGKLGNGGTPAPPQPDYNGDKSVPTPIIEGVLAGKEITQLIGAVNRTCVIADLMSYCWGRGEEGQIGDGTGLNRAEPTETKVFRMYRPSLYY